MKTRTIIVAICLAACGLAGCVERELTITSDPAGALVYMADEEIGRTPLTTPFTWYGDREIILRLEGHKTLKTHTTIYPPLYDIPPWDLFSQALVPWTYHYRVARHFTLEAQETPSDTELLGRAAALHRSNPLPENP